MRMTHLDHPHRKWRAKALQGRARTTLGLPHTVFRGLRIRGRDGGGAVGARRQIPSRFCVRTLSMHHTFAEASMSTSYEIVYFPSQGRAEPIRLLLALAGQPFTESHIDRPTWPQTKLTMPLGQVPVLIERDAKGERKIPQSQAILRHLARRFGFYGQGEQQMLQADIVADTCVDIGAGTGGLIYGAGRGNADAFAKYFSEAWPAGTKKLETLLAMSEDPEHQYFVHAGPTFADVLAFQVLHTHLALDPTCLDAAPALKQFHDRMAGLPAWKHYLDSRTPNEGHAARPAA
jgi:glutathione S-transferase